MHLFPSNFTTFIRCFPVVDEYRIAELHQKYKGKEELMDPTDFTVYHAIMVAGFAVRSALSLRGSCADGSQLSI
jgi:hypothetical protein